jgi:hypothetical protein
MPTYTATIISRQEINWDLYKYTFNITTVSSGGTSNELGFDINPITKGSIIDVRTIGLSTYTIYFRDTETDDASEFLRIANIHERNISNENGIFYNADSYIYGIAENALTGISTGVITITLLARGN